MPNSAPAATAMPLLLSGPTSNNCLYSSASRKYTILYMLIHGLHPTDINNAEIATNALGCALCAVYADKRQCSNTFFNLQLQCESKKSPLRFSDNFFSKRLGIFNKFFTHLLWAPSCARLQIFIQLSPTLTKLSHTKRDHPSNFIHFTRT